MMHNSWLTSDVGLPLKDLLVTIVAWREIRFPIARIRAVRGFSHRRLTMAHRGWSHVGLSTLDMERTRTFYEGVLGFKAVRCDIIKVKEGGQIRHIFFDTGQGQLLAFMEPSGVA